jgi:uncharacterized Zn-binding protein involved in type VI secretion
MGQPAAKQGDQITAIDTHIVMVPSASGPIPTPLPHSFNGIIDGNLSPNVLIMSMPAAVVGSTASNTPPHIPTSPGTFFQIPPLNKGTIILGSNNVMINSKPAARNGDSAQTCADPVPNMSAKVIAAGTVLIGG